MKLTQDRFTPAEFARTIHAVTSQPDTKFEDTLKPEYWTHVASKMRAKDRIELTAEDGTWFAELFVVAAAANWAKVSVLRFVELAEAKPGTKSSTPEQFVASWGGPKNLWRVNRKSDKALLKDGFESKELAQAWITEHEASLMV